MNLSRSSKVPGDKVYAGTLNGDSALEVNVSQLSTDSTISRIVRLVEQAQSQRAPVERSIDRFAAWYTPAVVLMAVFVAIIPPLLFNAPFLDANGVHGWLYRALALLIVACPCALGHQHSGNDGQLFDRPGEPGCVG